MKSILSVLLMLMWMLNLQAGDLKTVVLTTNMKCEKCAAKIEAKVRKEAGVKDVLTLLDDKSVTITFDTAVTNENKLIASVKKAGYEAQISADNDIHCKKGTKVMGECCKSGKLKGNACCSDTLTKPGKCCVSGAAKGAKCCIAQVKKAEKNAKAKQSRKK